MFEDLYRLGQYLLTIGIFTAVLSLVFVWLEGLFYFIQDVRNRHMEE